MPRLLRLFALASLLALAARAAEPLLTLRALEQRTVTFTAEEFAALPHVDRPVLEPHEKKPHVCSGVALRELPARVGAPSGESFRGPATQRGVLVRSKDNYTVLFSLAKFDDNFSARTILLADGEDGQPTPATAAPFRLVLPGDKRAARWARQVVAIEMVSAGEALPTSHPPK